MIKNWRPIFPAAVLAITLLFTHTTAHALFVEANPIAILNAAAPTQKQNGNTYSWTGGVATGFGLLVACSLFNSPFDLEIGAVYLNQSSDRSSSGSNLTQKTHSIHVPLLFRYHFDDRIAIGAGAYGSFAEGSISTVQNGGTTYASYASQGIHTRDYGLLLSARASLRIVSQLYFIVDGRYQHGFSNLAIVPPGTVGDVLNTRSMQAYLGLSYRFLLF